jgi:hypothetical protein
MILPAFEIQRPLDYEGPNRWRHSPALAVISILLSVRESIEGELMTRTKKVVITAFGDESKLAIVECDLNDPAAGEVQLSVEYTIVSGSDVATRHDILLFQESCSAKVFSSPGRQVGFPDKWPLPQLLPTHGSRKTPCATINACAVSTERRCKLN